MELQTNFYEEYACKWFKKSVDALLSHRREHVDKSYKNKGFIRNSKQLIPKNYERNIEMKEEIFPTATFQGYSGLLDSEANIKLDTKIDTDEIIKLITVDKFDSYKGFSTNKDDRTIILFEHILYVLSQFHLRYEKKTDIPFNVFKEHIMGKENNSSEHNTIKKEYYFPPVGTSPWFLLTLLNCQEYIYNIYSDDHHYDELKKKEYKLFDLEDDELEAKIDDHINYHMARCNVKELSFDSISLIIAVCCKIKVNNNFKNSPFFISCLKAIIEQQYSDGRFPTGATISFADSGDVIQQASIQVMSLLADAIIDYKFLVDCNDQTEEILDILCPSFRKLAGYMEYTFESSTENNVLIKGWGSDRLKIKNYTETWITSYACRFFHKYWFLEKAYSRIKALKFLGVQNFVLEGRVQNAKRKWNEIIEPDSILRPRYRLDTIISPLIKKREKGLLLIMPTDKEEITKEKLISFIIGGPPGSGKTFIVKEMTKTIGWPLVELSPSQFIKNGIEFIESNSKEIFDAINNLYHAVVFFDECDELFKDRKLDNLSNNSNRTILNFLTASMLPKLQKLHDKECILFAVGTNYLHKMDDAVRRDGRFDFRIIYDRYDEIARENYYKAKINKEIIAEDLQTEDLKYVKEEMVSALHKDMEAYVDKRNGEEEVNGDFSIDSDYLEWCATVAMKELNATKYDEKIKAKKTKYWQRLIKNHQNYKNMNELQILNVTIPLLKEIGAPGLLYVTAELEPFSNQQKPDLIVYLKDNNQKALFVEYKLAGEKGFPESFWLNYNEKKKFVEESSEIELQYIFSTNAKVADIVKNKLQKDNIVVIDEAIDAETLSTKIKTLYNESKEK